jgi:hypothetical protein
MHTGSHCKNKSIDLNHALNNLGLEFLSRSSGFAIRKARKINAANLIIGFYNAIRLGHVSLLSWARELSLLISGSVTKQAVFHRVNAGFIGLVEDLLQGALEDKLNLRQNGLPNRFSRILLQDSTCIALPAALRKLFPGNYSAGEIKAVAKLQVVFNLMAGAFESISLTPYNVNDQAASPGILALLRKGDLVIRDLGYFVLSVFDEIQKAEAFFISRYKNEVGIYDCKTEKELSLRKLVRNRKFVKKKILLGKEKKLCVTLYAIKLTAEAARVRRQRIRNDRDRRKITTPKKLELAGWDIFVTNAGELSAGEIRLYYKMRWNIEMIFKAWKSNLNLELSIPSNLKNPFLGQAIIYLLMLFVIIVLMPIYHIICISLNSFAWRISMLKLSQFAMDLFARKEWCCSLSEFENILPLLFYETRKRKPITRLMELT